MGLDATIKFRFEGNDEELNDLAYDLARRVGASSFYRHPCLRRDPADVIDVDIYQRYFGPGYERGHWPTIRSCIVVLLAQDDVHDLKYHADTYHGDDEMRYPYDPFDDEHMRVLDEHYARGYWRYKWGGERSPTDMSDVYGRPMKRFGYGGKYAAYVSVASGEKVELTDGEITKDSRIES